MTRAYVNSFLIQGRVSCDVIIEGLPGSECMRAEQSIFGGISGVVVLGSNNIYNNSRGEGTEKNSRGRQHN